jgi:hypothetical protein
MKKKILHHIEMPAYTWSIKYRWNKKLLCETNILNLINQCLDNFYQIKTKVATAQRDAHCSTLGAPTLKLNTGMNLNWPSSHYQPWTLTGLSVCGEAVIVGILCVFYVKITSICSASGEASQQKDYSETKVPLLALIFHCKQLGTSLRA